MNISRFIIYDESAIIFFATEVYRWLRRIKKMDL